MDGKDEPGCARNGPWNGKGGERRGKDEKDEPGCARNEPGCARNGPWMGKMNQVVQALTRHLNKMDDPIHQPYPRNGTALRVEACAWMIPPRRQWREYRCDEDEQGLKHQSNIR